MGIQYEFNEKTALVTGAGSGIGRAVAMAFGAQGARVLVSDTSEKSGRETTKTVNDTGGEAVFVRCDVSLAADVENMVSQAVHIFGGIDFAVNNAGIRSPECPVAEIEEEDVARSPDSATVYRRDGTHPPGTSPHALPGNLRPESTGTTPVERSEP
jgi:NAD(P)-dependent dehydrogenase (short-subunit alcohol dehydrogenase family)